MAQKVIALLIVGLGLTVAATSDFGRGALGLLMAVAGVWVAYEDVRTLLARRATERAVGGALQDVLAFHDAMDCPSGDLPAVPAPERVALRVELIREEWEDELRPALERGDLVAIADGLADLIYVIVGTAIEYGVDLGAVWDEVHRANMAKAGGPRRADGKVLKPSGWQPPDIPGVLARQSPLRSRGTNP